MSLFDSQWVNSNDYIYKWKKLTLFDGRQYKLAYNIGIHLITFKKNEQLENMLKIIYFAKSEKWPCSHAK